MPTDSNWEDLCAERRAALTAVIDQRFEIIEREVKHLGDLFKHRLIFADKALELQAKEYERRLDELNHAHGQRLMDLSRTLPRESFEIFQKDYNAFRLTTESSIAAAQAAARTWAVAIGLILVILTFALRFMGR